jgi:hypothetical protein
VAAERRFGAVKESGGCTVEAKTRRPQPGESEHVQNLLNDILYLPEDELKWLFEEICGD